MPAPLQKSSFITTLVLSVIFGFGAGAVGMIVVTAYVLPTPTFPGTSPTVLRGRLAGTALDEAAPSVDPARAAVLFMPRISRDGGPVHTYVSGEAVGAGIVLTSDGWLLTAENTFAKGRTLQDVVALIGAKAYPLKDMVKDPFTGVMFLKIEGNNLPVTAFGKSADLSPGGFAFAFDAEAGLHRLGVLAYDRISVATAADVVWSSERAEKTVHLSGADDLLPGSMVLGKKGEVIGVLASHDARGARAIPFEAFSGVISGVLREKRVARPYLGVRFTDLSGLLAPDATHSAGRGAMLVGFADPTRPAVAKKSPADVAGLVAGDVIEAVNGEEVSVKNALPELLAEYQPGSVLTLTVLGAKGERSVDVTLGTAK